jgi:hypothetical protein
MRHQPGNEACLSRHETDHHDIEPADTKAPQGSNPVGSRHMTFDLSEKSILRREGTLDMSLFQVLSSATQMPWGKTGVALI